MGCGGGTDCESGAADLDISEALTDEEWSGVQDFWVSRYGRILLSLCLRP